MISTKIKFLVVGGDGLIGSSLVNFLNKANESIVATTRKKLIDSSGRKYLDLKDDLSGWNLNHSVDVAVFCSGMTNADHCESDK